MAGSGEDSLSGGKAREGVSVFGYVTEAPSVNSSFLATSDVAWEIPLARIGRANNPPKQHLLGAGVISVVISWEADKS